MKFKVEDRVRCIESIQSPDNDNAGGGWAKNFEFIITSINDFGCARKNSNIYFAGVGGYGVYEEYLELVTNKLSMKLNSMMKRLLDADTKKLIKGGLINGDLQLTEEGKEALLSVLFEANKVDLVKIAEENIAEAKEHDC